MSKLSEKYTGITPGNWEVYDSAVGDPAPTYVVSGETIIASCPLDIVGVAQSYHNAYLIADAPALAANTDRALRKLRYMLTNTPHGLRSAELNDVIKILEGAP